MLKLIKMQLIFGDVDGLERLQSRCIKAALGLPLFAHQSALLAALRISRVHEELRRGVLQGLADIFRCQSRHRLSQIVTRGLAFLQPIHNSYLIHSRARTCTPELIIFEDTGQCNWLCGHRCNSLYTWS